VCTVEYNGKNSIIRFHTNPQLINFDTSSFADKYPSFWKIVEPTLEGTSNGGYYDWPDPDGVTRSKYMYIQPIGVPTADGVMLQTSATTYMEEFTVPSKQLEQKLNSSIQQTVNSIKIATESMSSSNTILLITIITMIIVIIIVCIMAMSISRPIKQLTEIADKVSMGDLQTKIDVHTNDEINDLAESFRRMINAFKMMVSMQEDQEEEK
ncbi:MAG TPA: HAMP domain-containing protein, partial [Methanospirillum sp.]|uniref:HAMP domain-containing protein n=1 Tax=Methanospirillum sp. TaxID=45200 RepID=UPI002C0AC04A